MTIRHTTLVLGMICLISLMMIPSSPAIANDNACDGLQNAASSGNGKKKGNDKAQSNNDCPEVSICDINSDGVITAAELLEATGTSIDWQAVIDSIEGSLSGSDTNNNGVIDTPAEFVELKRVTGC